MMIKKNKVNGLELSRLGLGCMRLSMTMTQQPIVEKESISVIQKSLDAGVNLLNTGDFYGDGENEKLIAKAMKGYDRNKAFVSLKYGTFGHIGKGQNTVDVGPKNVKKYIAASLTRLKMDYVDLYQPARIDIGIPIEETIGAIADLVQEGLVRHIGLSEVDADTLKRANAIHPISLLEMCYSITDVTAEQNVIPAARELGVGLVAFGVLGLGKLFKNTDDSLVKMIGEIAREKEVSLSQVAHAYMLTKGKDVIPLMGPRTQTQLEDSLQSTQVVLTIEDLKRIEKSKKESHITGPSMPKMIIKNGVLIR